MGTSFLVLHNQKRKMSFFFFNFCWDVANYRSGYVLFWWWPCQMIARKRSKRKEIRIRRIAVWEICGDYPKKKTVSQVLPSQSTKGDGRCKRQLPRYWSWASHKSEMGFLAINPALCTHLQPPPCWVSHVPPSRWNTRWLLPGVWVCFESCHGGCRYCPLTWPRIRQGGTAAWDLMPPALTPAALVVFWLPLQPQHLRTAALLAQSMRA